MTVAYCITSCLSVSGSLRLVRYLLHHDQAVGHQGDRPRHLYLGPHSVVGGGHFQGLEVRVWQEGADETPRRPT